MLEITQKINWITLTIIFFALKNFWIIFCEYVKTEKSNYKSKNFETKYLNNTQKIRFLKVKSIILESEKDLMKLKHRELKDREVKTKKRYKTYF